MTWIVPTPESSSTNSIHSHKLSWLEQAEKHHRRFLSSHHEAEEHLMYICLFSYYGMFDCTPQKDQSGD